jgi:hypothetical protein
LETKEPAENQNICIVFIQRGSFDEIQFGKEELEWGGAMLFLP